MINNKSKTR